MNRKWLVSDIITTLDSLITIWFRTDIERLKRIHLFAKQALPEKSKSRMTYKVWNWAHTKRISQLESKTK